MIRRGNNLILIIIINLIFGLVKAQVVEYYDPIVITQRGDSIIDSKRVDKVIIDFYKTKYELMKKCFFKYDHENSIVTFWDEKDSRFCPFIYLDKQEEVKDISLGLFSHFDLKKINDNLFEASGTYGSYPSHHLQMTSIEILKRNELSLVMKFNFLDEFGWEDFGVVVLYNYKYLELLNERNPAAS